MKHLLFFSCFLMLTLFSFCQPAGFKYAHSIGGSDYDGMTANVILRNGNIVSVGETHSNDFDINGNHGDYDCLVVCTSPMGQILWKKVIGGTGWESFTHDVDTTTDGNIVVGFTTASNDGDISGNHGGWDIEFMKFSPDGTLIWAKTYGGSGSEVLGRIRSTPGGGIIAAIVTTSSVSGNVSGTSHGANDEWIVKLDQAGAIEWEKLYGGSNAEGTPNERGGTIGLTNDGGYTFSISTSSTDGDLTGLLPGGATMGASDIWLVHIDATANIIWSKLIGGSLEDDNPLLYSYGNSIYLLFATKSIDRDLSINLGLYDLALFKYTANGTFLWKKEFGSFSFDGAGDITGVKGDEITIAGGVYSISFAGFPVNIGPNTGFDEAMLVYRIDTLNGNIKWLKSIKGNGYNSLGGVKIAPNNDLYLAGMSESISYDITGNHGSYDAVVLAIAGGNTFTGNVFLDANNNNVYEPGEEQPDYVRVIALKNNQQVAQTTTQTGVYKLEVDTGLFTVRTDFGTAAYYSSVPVSYNHTFLSDNQVYTQDIALHEIAGMNDLKVSISPITIAFPGHLAYYALVGYNVGTTTIASGTVGFKKDPLLSYDFFSIAPSQLNGDSATWNFTNLAPFDSVVYIIRAYVSTTLQYHTALNFNAAIRPVAADAYPADNTLRFRQIIVGSYDPNCKANNLADTMLLTAIQSGEYVDYTIAFQNTGTAAAFDIRVIDTLPATVLSNTVQLLSSSAPFIFNQQGNVLNWEFKNINLPDSNTNEPASHGYVSFRIKPSAGLLAGDSIVNRAAIYFDFNAPVITGNNSIKVSPVGTVPLQLISFTGSLQNGPAGKPSKQVQLNWSAINEINTRSFEIERSGSSGSFAVIGKASASNTTGMNNYSFLDETPLTGISYYRLKITDIDGRSNFSRIIEIENNKKDISIINSMQIHDELLIQHFSNENNISFYISDAIGKILLSGSLLKSTSLSAINISRLSSGTYFLIMENDKRTVIPFIKK